MIAWHHQHNCFWRTYGECGQRNRRRCIARTGLKQDGRISYADFGQLRADNPRMRGVGDDNWRGEAFAVHHPQHRQLKHRMRAGERQKLLRRLRR